MDSCTESLKPRFVISYPNLLATGARWSEAEKLNRSQVTKYRVTFTKTKGKKNRTVPISKELYDEIPNKHGRLFQPCRKAFERAIKRAGIELPDGQCTHVLRHTFGKSFYDERREYIGIERNLRPRRHKNVTGVCAFCPRSSRRRDHQKPLIWVKLDAACWRQNGGRRYKQILTDTNKYEEIRSKPLKEKISLCFCSTLKTM